MHPRLVCKRERSPQNSRCNSQVEQDSIMSHGLLSKSLDSKGYPSLFVFFHRYISLHILKLISFASFNTFVSSIREQEVRMRGWKTESFLFYISCFIPFSLLGKESDICCFAQLIKFVSPLGSSPPFILPLAVLPFRVFGTKQD